MKIALQCQVIVLSLAAMLVAGCGGGATSAGVGTPGGNPVQNSNADLTGLVLACTNPELPCDNIHLVVPEGGPTNIPEGFLPNANLEGERLSDYTSVQSAAVEAVTITPTALISGVTIMVNGAVVPSGQTSDPILLEPGGETEIVISVTALDGVTNRIYTITVTRLSPDNADLSGLSLSAGTLSPQFDREEIDYASSVDNAVENVRVTAVSAEPFAAIEVNGAAVASGVQSSPIDLAVGVNTPPIEVRVIAISGADKVYRITMTRLGSANLTGITVVGLAEDQPPGANEVPLSLESGFQVDVTSYAVMAENRIGDVIVTATTQESGAEVVFERETGSGFEEFMPGTPIPLKEYDEEDPDSATNVIRIRVSHPFSGGDEPLTRTYNLTVIRQAPPLYAPEAYLKPVDAGPEFAYGRSVAFTAAGGVEILAVGAPGALGGRGAVYLFENDSGLWTWRQTLEGEVEAPCDEFAEVCEPFGFSVALSIDGTVLAVGAPSESVAVDEDQELIEQHGAVYLYTREPGGSWSGPLHVPPFVIGAAYRFGHGVALAESGGVYTLVVGVPGDASTELGVFHLPVPGDHPPEDFLRPPGAVLVYLCQFSGADPPCELDPPQALIKMPDLQEGNVPERFGASLALTVDGNRMAVGAPGRNDDRGAVFLYDREAGIWAEPRLLPAAPAPRSGDLFGSGIALSGAGDLLVAGSPGQLSSTTGVGASPTLTPTANNSGAVYVFTEDSEAGEEDSGWIQQVFIKPSNTRAGFRFGQSVALSRTGDFLVVGATGENSLATTVDGNQRLSGSGGSNSGAAYQFRRVFGEWSQIAFIKVPNSRAGIRFGTSLALSDDGELVAGGAPGESSASTGEVETPGVVMGSDYPGDDTAANRGAAYLYRAVAPFEDPVPPPEDPGPPLDEE
jgi:hypothetical protein